MPLGLCQLFPGFLFMLFMHFDSPVIFLMVYEPRWESVANLSTIASNSA